MGVYNKLYEYFKGIEITDSKEFIVTKSFTHIPTPYTQNKICYTLINHYIHSEVLCAGTAVHYASQLLGGS